MRAFLADTLALLTFFTGAGVLNERFLAGMDWSEVSRARAIGALLMVPTARPYGLWRDWLMGRFAGPGALSQLAWGSVALLLFQVPLYALILWAGGAEGGEICAVASARPASCWLRGDPTACGSTSCGAGSASAQGVCGHEPWQGEARSAKQAAGLDLDGIQPARKS
jgi:hypothetical protein